MAFYTGLFMGADGIETDVRLTRDGQAVLFHDSTLLRMTGEEGASEDYTLAQLLSFNVTKNGFSDKIATLEDFLRLFSFRDITFAIELKGENTEAETARLLRKYNMQTKTTVTSFNRAYLLNFRKIAPEFETGLLTTEEGDEVFDFLRKNGINEYCPLAEIVTEEKVTLWHSMGFRVRAWGVKSEELMKNAYLSGVDGMTVNFPDKLTGLKKQTI